MVVLWTTATVCIVGSAKTIEGIIYIYVDVFAQVGSSKPVTVCKVCELFPFEINEVYFESKTKLRLLN